VSSVWQATYRLLGERLRERLAEQADRGLTPDRDDELLLRLLGLVVDLHEWHRVDRYGQCRRCRLRHRWWRNSRMRCSVVEIIEYYVDEEMEFIWRQVFGRLGRQMTLQEAEEWVQQQRREDSSHEPDDLEETVGMAAIEGEKHEWR